MPGVVYEHRAVVCLSKAAFIKFAHQAAQLLPTTVILQQAAATIVRLVKAEVDQTATRYPPFPIRRSHRL